MNAIGSIMTENPLTGSRTDTLDQVRKVMLTEGIQSLPIVDHDLAVVGMVTSTDLLSELPGSVQVHRIMATDVVTVGPDASLHEAAELMRRHFIHHLVVVEDDRVVGIVSAFDLLAQL